jgi:hypothetical protein
MIENKLVHTHADIRKANESMLRDSLGPSRLEMPPDQDPHYMISTLLKAAHALDPATQTPRPPATAITEQTQTTASALIGLQTEARERISKVQERLKSKIVKDVAEHLDVPALLLRKFNFLKNPRYVCACICMYMYGVCVCGDDKIVKDVAEHVDVPALLLRKFKF